MTPGNSLVAVYRASDKKLLRYEDNDGRAVAHITMGRIKVTSYGMGEGFYVSEPTGKLMCLGEPANVGKPLARR